jgi:hypothetical protein
MQTVWVAERALPAGTFSRVQAAILTTLSLNPAKK